jgi:hypothetical protein
MFIGRLGRDRTFMLTPEADPPELPSDLDGIMTAMYDDDSTSPADIRGAIAPACSEIRIHLASAQTRFTPEPKARDRLDHAMERMSRDLESAAWLFNRSSERSRR